MNKDFIQNRAFTLIETLVAISVLMIAIAGPLTTAAKGYTAAINAKNQLVASNLAQDGLEFISYMKDNQDWSAVGSGIWDYWNAPAVFSSCTYVSQCTFPASIVATPPPGFFRYYWFSVPAGNDRYQIIANVKIVWKTGPLDDSVVVQELLTDFVR